MAVILWSDNSVLSLPFLHSDWLLAYEGYVVSNRQPATQKLTSLHRSQNRTETLWLLGYWFQKPQTLWSERRQISSVESAPGVSDSGRPVGTQTLPECFSAFTIQITIYQNVVKTTKTTTKLPNKTEARGMIVHAFNPRTREAEEGWSQWDQEHLGLHSEFQASWSNKKTLFQNEKRKKEIKTIKSEHLDLLDRKSELSAHCTYNHTEVGGRSGSQEFFHCALGLLNLH